MRVGLYGGSFDPVHLGHLLVAEAAIEELALDRLIFIPAAQSPFKPGTQPAHGALRTRLLRLALAGQPRFEVDDLELQRGGVSYSVETVRTFAKRHPEATLFWLIGADHVVTLPTWREAEDLARLIEFVVIPRPSVVPPNLPAPFRLRHLRGWPLSVSASEIRQRVSKGRSIGHLVSPEVAEAIAEERMYR